MLEELAIAFAEIVQAGGAVVVAQESVLRTLAIAGKQITAFATLAGQHLLLDARKLLLLRRIHHLGNGLLVQVAKLVLGEDKVVA